MTDTGTLARTPRSWQMRPKYCISGVFMAITSRITGERLASAASSTARTFTSLPTPKAGTQ